MIGPVRWLLALAAMLAVAMAAPASAQGAPDIVGDWHGTIPSPQGDVVLVIHVTRGEDGALSAKVENYTQNPGNMADITTITAADGHLSWRVAPINATYEGTWDEAAQQWKGTFNQGGAVPFNFVRGAPPSRPVISGLDGVWVGAIEVNGVRLRQVLAVRRSSKAPLPSTARPISC